jgi:hypothetical protein
MSVAAADGVVGGIRWAGITIEIPVVGVEDVGGVH